MSASDSDISSESKPDVDAVAARAAEVDYQAQVLRDLPRNYTANLIHGLLGQTGFRLVHAPTFLPAYVFLLSGSELLVGVALAAQHFGASLSSIVGANLIEHRRRVLPVGFVVGALMRLQVLGIALSGLLLPPEYAFIAVCIFLFLFGLFMGMQGVTFNFLMSKVIPVNLRGRLTGLRNFLAGLTAAGVAYLGGKYFIETNFLGNGYSATFLTSFCLTSLGLMVLLFIREPQPPVMRKATKLRHRFRELPDLLRADPAYTRFFMARAMSALGMISAPFFILYAGDRVGMSGANIGVLTIAFMLAQTSTNLVWGALADRKGNRFVFIAAVTVWMSASLIVMMASSILAFFMAFAFLGIGVGGFQIGSQNLVLEFGLRQDLPMRIAISNAATSLMMGVGPLLGGAIAAVFSHFAVFWTAVAFQAFALVVVVVFVDEPRFRPDPA